MAKRLSRTTLLQYQELLQFVRANKVVLTGKTTLIDQKKIANLWEEFATSINSKGFGPVKNAEQWRRVSIYNYLCFIFCLILISIILLYLSL